MEIKPYEIEGVTLPRLVFTVNSSLYPQDTVGGQEQEIKTPARNRTSALPPTNTIFNQLNVCTIRVAHPDHHILKVY
jgi:hypothetical protein